MNRALAIVAAFFVAVVAVALSAPAFLDWNRYKSEISDRISSFTGEPIEIAGDVDFSLVPEPHFTATDISVGDGGGIGSVERVEARLAFWPLLLGNVEAVSLNIVRPILDVRLSDIDAAKLLPADDNALPADRQLEHVVIESGTIRLIGDAGGTIETLENVNLEVSRTRWPGGYIIASDLHVVGWPVTLVVERGTPSDGAVPLTVQMRLPASDTRGEAYGRLVTDGGGVHFIGEMELEGPDIAGLGSFLASLLEGEAGDPGDAADRPFSLRSSVEVLGNAVRLDEVSMEISGVTGRGNALLSTSAGGLRADIEARVGRVNLDRADRGLNIDPLRRWLARLAAADLSGSFDLAAEAVLVDGGVVRNAELILSLDRGAITVDRLSANLPGATDVSATGKVSALVPKPTYSLALDAETVNLRRTLEWLGCALPEIPPGRLRSGTVSATVSSDGDTVTISKLVAAVDFSRIEGGITLSLGERASFGLSLVVDRLDWDGYFPEIANRGGPGKVVERLMTAGYLERLPKFLRGFDANVQLRFEQMTVGGVQLRGAVLDALLFEGRLDLRELGYDEGWGGKWRLSGRLTDLGGEPRGKVGLRAQFADLPAMLGDLSIRVPGYKDAMGPVSLAGTAAGSLSEFALDLRLEGEDLAAELSGNVRDVLKDPEYDLDLRLLTDGAEGASAAGAELQLVTTGGANSAVIRRLHLEYGGSTLSGKGAVDWSGPRPVVQATFTSGGMDLRQLELFGSGGGQLFDPGILNAFDADVSVVATSIDLSPTVRLGGLELSASLANGVLQLHALKARLAGGRLEMTGRVAVPDAPVISASLRIHGAATDALGLSSAGFSVEGGTFDLALDLAPGQPSSAEPAAAVRGRGHLEVRNGTIEIASTVPGVVAVDRHGFPAILPFTSLQIPFLLENGDIMAPEVVISTEQGRARGNLDLDLAGGEIRAEFDFVEGTLAGTRLEVSGPLRNPDFDVRPVATR